MAIENNFVKWRKKKKKPTSNQSPGKLNGAWMKEFVGNPRINQDNSNSYVWPPQMGMDKIRATTKIGKYFVEFASTSTVHGINHLVAPHRHPIERFLTVIFIVGALITSILLSWHFWGRFQNSSTILVIDHKYRYEDFTVTTPSLLACPVEKIDEESFGEVFERNKIEDSQEARDFFNFISNATYYEMENTPNYTAVASDKWLKILWELRSNPEIEIFGANADSDDSMDWVMTEEGFCMMFFSSIRVYYPLEVPEIDDASRTSPIGEYHDIYVHPQEIVTSKDVKKLTISQRRCKILEERGLRLWPIYTHNMCILECKYELIREQCNCYPHFVRPTPDVAICNVNGLRCVGKHRKKFAKLSREEEEKCGCYTNCDGAEYDIGRQHVTYTKAGSPNVTIVKIFVVFPHDKILRELLFGFNDFLAAVGGAGGLFLGASILSFIEIFYFVSIRLFWYGMQLRKERKNELERKNKIKMFINEHPLYYK